MTTAAMTVVTVAIDGPKTLTDATAEAKQSARVETKGATERIETTVDTETIDDTIEEADDDTAARIPTIVQTTTTVVTVGIDAMIAVEIDVTVVATTDEATALVVGFDAMIAKGIDATIAEERAATIAETGESTGLIGMV